MFDRIAWGLPWDMAWTLTEGCTHVSPACDHCWSARESHKRARHPNAKIQTRYAGLADERGQWTGIVRPQWDDLTKPLKRRKPTVWAVWNDLFHEAVPDDFIYHALGVMGLCDQHIFMVITKRIERAHRFFTKQEPYTSGNIEGAAQKIHHELTGEDPSMWLALHWPFSNVWLGTTVELADYAWRLKFLLNIPAATRIVFLEPAIGFVDLKPYLPPADPHLDGVILGGESGLKARPMHPEIPRRARDACARTGTPFFFKHWGEYQPMQKDCGFMGSLGVEEGDICISPDGTWFAAEKVYYCFPNESEGEIMRRVGKRAAGRMLDNRAWDELPEVKRS